MSLGQLLAFKLPYFSKNLWNGPPAILSVVNAIKNLSLVILQREEKHSSLQLHTIWRHNQT